MKIAIACEHAGFELKNKVKEYLIEKGYDVADLGADSSEPIDYPYIAANMTEMVVKGDYSSGILICGTGIGMSIAACKVPGARAALCTNSYMAKMARNHNDANILCLGSWITGLRLSYDIVDTFLANEFEGGRHQRRINLIYKLEKKFNME